jgi:protein-disulfide isomerase
MKLALVLLVVGVHTASAQPMRRAPDRAATYAIAVDGHPGDGPADAKVTMVVVHDYTDPYSHKNRTTLDELRKKYQRDLRIVFRHMVVHPRNAMAAALASCAAHKQKKFDQMEDKLWDGFAARQWDMTDVDLGNGPQKCWETPDGCQFVTAWAKEIGLNMGRFHADMKTCEAVIADDMRDLGQDFAVQATPTFFVNGRVLSGAMPTEQYVKLIDEELALANDRIKKGTPKGRYYKTWVIDKGLKRVDVAAAPAPAPPPVMPRPGRREPDRALTYAVPVDGYPSHGPADALVTLVKVQDYADPYSDKNRATLEDLRKKYGKDLRVVYRNVVVHPRNAMAAALASCAANKQNKFDQMEVKLWEAFTVRQLDATEVDLGNGPENCWETKNGCQHVNRRAKEIGLDLRRFEADMKACTRTVNDDMFEMSNQFAVTATPGFFVNGRFLSGAQPIESFSTLIDEELAKANDRVKKGTPRAKYYKQWISGQGEKQVAQQPSTMPPNRPARVEPDKSKSYAIKVDGYPSKGPADAKITVVMFFDYATPYADKARATLDDLMQQYGKDLRIVYRTRLVHPRNAMAAALAMCAADKQKKFAAMDTTIWEKGFQTRQLDLSEVDLGNGPQKCWDTPDSCKNVVDHAKEIGLDLARFKTDLKSCVKFVNDDDADAGTFAVNATPTFFINGRPLSGAQPVQAFAAVIDEELKKANDRIKQGTPKGRYYKAWVVDKGEKSVTP